MSDQQVIKKLEHRLGIRLEKVDEEELNNVGYKQDSRERMTWLRLSRCDLGSLPSEIGELEYLRFLDLSFNKLSALPPDITRLKNLQGLLLINNQFITVPSAVCKLLNLQVLDLRDNHITSIPIKINNLQPLEQLILSSNQIEYLPNELFSLYGLNILNLKDNRLQEIPSQINQLKHLQQLDIRANQLRELPREILDLNLEFKRESDFGSGIFWAGNPLDDTIEKALQKGQEGFLNYIKQITPPQTITVHEAKILIVGEPGAGKTTLMRKLFDPNISVPDKDQKATLGVVIRMNREFINPGNLEQKISAHIWDFGGQDIQYMLHQYFLTPESLYILLSDDRKDEKRFDYWFRIIRLLGTKSPVLVVLNKFDLSIPTNFDQFKYRQEYPDLKFNVYEIDLKDKGLNWDLLVQTISKKMFQIPHITQIITKLWQNIRTKIESFKSEKYILLETFENFCTQEGISKKAEQVNLLHFLHNLGVVLWFEDQVGLANTIFLQPNWIVKALYSVLDPEFFLRDNDHKWLVDRKTLFKFWQCEKYTLADCHYLLQLLLKDRFDLCYELEEKKNWYLFPSLLPEKIPDYKWNVQSNLYFRFQYPFIPEGIISRLIVRVHDLIKKKDEIDLVWKSGVVLQEDNCQAEIRQYENKENGLKVIDIKIAGNTIESRKKLLTKIRKQIKHIHSTGFEDISYTEMVACQCHECKEKPIPHFFEYETLQNYKRNSRNYITCPLSIRDVSITEIEGLVMEKEDSHDKKLSLLQRDRIFISYSHKDNNWLKKLKVHLKAYQFTNDKIDFWDDTRIKAGEKWKAKIESNLRTAKAAILLISTDFLASDFIHEIELPTLLDAAEKDGTLILGIILRPIFHKKQNRLMEYQMVNSLDRPLSGLKVTEQDEIFVKLVERIDEVFK